MKSLDVSITPADFEALKKRNLRKTTCVVFDILRATSTMVTALQHGAATITPVAEIPDALALKKKKRDLLLAGEREGLRITAEQTGSIDFDLGNSPREFTRDAVEGRSIAITTTNGTRALRACAHAGEVIVGAFLNLGAVTKHLKKTRPEQLLLICSGTHDEAALEDILAAGAVCDGLWKHYKEGRISDSAVIARHIYLQYAKDLERGFGKGRNGKRLLSLPALKKDVAFCAQLDRYEILPMMDRRGVIRAIKG